MVLRENDFSEKMQKLLSLPFAKLGEFNINVRMNDLYSLHGMVSHSPISADLKLEFYIDQLSSATNAHEILEQHLAYFLETTSGAFTGRSLNYGRDNEVVTYMIKVYDYNQFLDNVYKAYNHLIDKEFTQALEAKLSED